MDEQGQQYMGFVVESAQHMQRLINDLREYAQVTHKRHRLKPVDCELVLTAAKANLRSQIEDTRAEVTQDPLPTVRGDATQLTQVFQNLIGNAIKYLDGRAPKVHVVAILIEPIDCGSDVNETHRLEVTAGTRFAWQLAVNSRC